MIRRRQLAGRRLLAAPLVAAAVAAGAIWGGLPHAGRASPSRPPHGGLTVHASAHASGPGSVVPGRGAVPASAAGPPGAVSLAGLRGLPWQAPGALVPLDRPVPARGYSVQRVAYRSQGLRVTATLLLPSAPGPHPLVLALHGLVTSRGYRPGADAMPLAIRLAGHGMLVAVPDYRGLGGGAPDPRTEPLPLADATDALTLLADLRGSPRVDRTRIGIVAHSLGANVAEVILAVDPEIRAAVLYAPSESQDATLYLRRPGFFRGRPGLGSPAQQPALYQAMSPGLHFDSLRCSVLLEHGTADRVIPWRSSVVAAQELRAAGATVRLVLVPGAGHDLRQAVWAPHLAEGTSFLLAAL
jgi:dipeptidyl aminopeptidase/acylaminoacyl peptidase